MTKIFVTGTDTNVGKTVAATMLDMGLNAHYWKPVQTGTQEGRDSDFVARWLGPSRVLPESYTFAAPLSPDAAAVREGRKIHLAQIKLPGGAESLVAEGAGGALVPLNATSTMADLMLSLGFHTLIVARTALGTINHTLLTVEALRLRNLPLAGVLLMGNPQPETAASIERHGKIAILGTIPFCRNFTAGWFAESFARLDLSSLYRKEPIYDVQA